jgi:HK97 family phage major capsid protein
MNQMVFPTRRAPVIAEKIAKRAGMFALTLLGNGKAAAWCYENEVRVKTTNESTATEGGFLVPEELLPTIISLRDTYGAFRAAAQVAAMKRDHTSIPKRTGGLTAYWRGEGQAITESAMTFGQVSLTAKALSTLVRSSSELDEDSAVDLGASLLDETAYAFAQKEDEAGFNGDATSTYGGCRGIAPQLLDGTRAGRVTAATGHDTFAEIDLADLTNLIAALPSYALPGARWFCSSVGFALTFCRLAATAGGLIATMVNGRAMLSFLGWPIQISTALPTSAGDLSNQIMLLFGDLSMAATLGDRSQLVLARSDLGPSFGYDQVLFKGTERVDIVAHGVGTATAAGPIVGLMGE